MPLPVIRPDIARLALARLCPESMAEIVERLQEENPEYLHAVRAMASRSRVGSVDAMCVACFCYYLLLAQNEVEELEVLVGGKNAPLALR